MSVHALSKKLALVVAASCGALILGSSTARGSDTREPPAVAKEHAQVMSSGKNHEEARDATMRADSARKLLAQQHAEAMSSGKSHEEARAATFSSVDASKIHGRAMRHLDALNEGDSHEQARVESDKE